MLAGALAGISEHAVMFPIDSIKVRFFVCTHLSAHSLVADTYAGLCYVSTCRVQRRRQRLFSHIVHRGHARPLERRLLRHPWCWPCTRSPLWHPRGRQGARRRKQRRQSMGRHLHVLSSPSHTLFSSLPQPSLVPLPPSPVMLS